MTEEEQVAFIKLFLEHFAKNTGIRESRLTGVDVYADGVRRMQEKYMEKGEEFQCVVNDLDFLLVLT